MVPKNEGERNREDDDTHDDDDEETKEEEHVVGFIVVLMGRFKSVCVCVRAEITFCGMFKKTYTNALIAWWSRDDELNSAKYSSKRLSSVDIFPSARGSIRIKNAQDDDDESVEQRGEECSWW